MSVCDTLDDDDCCGGDGGHGGGGVSMSVCIVEQAVSQINVYILSNSTFNASAYYFIFCKI